MNGDSISVLVAASEAAPLASTGGLAEVAGSLPLALRDAGCRTAVVLPAYRTVLEGQTGWETVARDVFVPVGPVNLTAEILMGELAPDVPAFLVRRDEFFDRSELYGGGQGDYFDNPERFIFFSRAVAAMGDRIRFVPDVILANDWQTGLIMPLLALGALPRTAGVFSIHNMGYLGLVPRERTENIGLPPRFYGMDGLEYYGLMSLLKAGIVFAQALTTVSPTYAREVQTPEGGQGLDGLMRAVSDRLHGILNGVDYRVWNPALDRCLAARYTPEDPAGKAACKKSLLESMGLTGGADKPLLGLVTRLTAQKGLGLLSEAAPELMKLDVNLVVLGTGEVMHEEMMTRLKQAWPDRVGLTMAFDPVLAHRVIAGADMLLMPSLYEPCGLTQLYGLKYGAVPVVRATGGLNDTVKDPSEGGPPGTGFKFNRFHPGALVRAVRRAVEVYQNREAWRAMMLAGMAEDYSWDRSAREYVRVFEKALASRRGGWL
ncbi:MAG: glycogen synthase GlgA [Thermodesulfobacteriota bacterium]